MRLTLLSLLLAVVLGVLLGAVMGFAPKEKVSCVNIYYDEVDESGTLAAKRLVTQMKMLLKEFPQFVIRDSAVNDYHSGEINQCAASIYIGSSFDNHLPNIFLGEFVEAKANVAWLGYNIWQLGAQLEEIFGYRYMQGFISGGALVELVQSSSDRSEVLAEVKHSGSREMIPYVLRSHNHYYLADVPLVYGHESERYRIFKDLLEDILKGQHAREKPLVKRNVGLMWEDLMKVEL